MAIDIKPYQVAVSDEALADLQRRLDNTIWPDDPGNEDWSYGVNADYLRGLVDYWRTDYDWRAVEAKINAYENFRTVIDGVPIHFLRRKGKGPNPIPLIITHGWPWTFWDMNKVIDPLADPAAFGGDPADAFDVIVPSLPGYGFSGPPPRAGLNFWKWADLWHKLMTEGLGYEKYAASGADWGAMVTAQLGHKYADHLYGVHTMHPMLLNQFDATRKWDVTDRKWDSTVPMPGGGATKYVAHYAVHVLDPQTLAYSLADSPVGTLAWLLERWRSWSDCDGDVETVFPREHIITSTMIYWITRTIGSSMRAYADATRYLWEPSHDRTPWVEAPTAVSFLGGENPIGVTPPQRIDLFKAGPRVHAYNAVQFEAHDRGGHFGYYEQPQAVLADLRKMFRDRRG
ncbi:epoxide hydrolase family protein [Sphingomonas mali]|uniref:epoxide hydrolase family protein n=1 Tax=Sphingomonas mali TaxID=40682 RepID=UPI000835E139|nr:epoxide hydrolase family protein [Sphingomonas mali]